MLLGVLLSGRIATVYLGGGSVLSSTFGGNLTNRKLGMI